MAVPGPDPLVLRLLETVFPELPLEAPALGEIMRDACCFAMSAAMDHVNGELAPGGLSDYGALATACMDDRSGIAGIPEIAEAGALAAITLMGEARPFDRESFRPTLDFSCRCLSRQLPLGLRSRLVLACAHGLGCLGLVREMKGLRELFRPVFLERSAKRPWEPVNDAKARFGAFASEPSFIAPELASALSGGSRFRMDENDFAACDAVKALSQAPGRPPASDAGTDGYGGGFPR
jgi:hypothetical protein